MNSSLEHGTSEFCTSPELQYMLGAAGKATCCRRAFQLIQATTHHNDGILCRSCQPSSCWKLLQPVQTY